MMVFTLTLATLFTWFGVAVPVAHAIREREDQDFAKAMNLLRAHAVRTHHGTMRRDPTLAACSLQELQERYDIRRSYEGLPYS